jgi:drug/metabolite transporter (DMT)-like permease
MTKFDVGKLSQIVGLVLLALAVFKFFVAHERPNALLSLGLILLVIGVFASKRASP